MREHPAVSILRIRKNMDSDFRDLENKFRDLSGIVIGFDGKNGLRSEVIEIKRTMREDINKLKQEVRDVANFQTKLIGGIIAIWGLIEAALTFFHK